MNLSKTALALLAVLIVLLGFSVYLWTRVGVGNPEVDDQIARTMQSFTCQHCGHTFQLRIGEVTEQRRRQGSVKCPKCSQVGARKAVPAQPNTQAGARDPDSEQPSNRADQPNTATQSSSRSSAIPNHRPAPNPQPPKSS